MSNCSNKDVWPGPGKIKLRALTPPRWSDKVWAGLWLDLRGCQQNIKVPCCFSHG